MPPCNRGRSCRARAFSIFLRNANRKARLGCERSLEFDEVKPLALDEYVRNEIAAARDSVGERCGIHEAICSSGER